VRDSAGRQHLAETKLLKQEVDMLVVV
jgi:hypothetical protein